MVKFSLCLIRYHAMMTYGSGDLTPRILDLGFRWKWVVTFMYQSVYSGRKSTGYPWDTRTDGPQSRSREMREKISSSNQNWTPAVQPVTRGPWTILCRLSMYAFVCVRPTLYWLIDAHYEKSSIHESVDVFRYFRMIYESWKWRDGGDNREKYGSVVNEAKVFGGRQKQGTRTCFHISDYGLHWTWRHIISRQISYPLMHVRYFDQAIQKILTVNGMRSWPSSHFYHETFW
jgi:hypothetical protein